MSRKKSAIKAGSQPSPILVSEIVALLRLMSQMCANPRTGNQELSRALRDVADALKPFSSKPVSGLKLQNMRTTQGTKPRRVAIELPSTLDSLTQSEIEAIANDSRYSKSQLIELGAKRFAISPASLARMRVDQLRGALLAAVEREASLDAITREATRSGRSRSS